MAAKKKGKKATAKKGGAKAKRKADKKSAKKTAKKAAKKTAKKASKGKKPAKATKKVAKAPVKASQPKRSAPRKATKPAKAKATAKSSGAGAAAKVGAAAAVGAAAGYAFGSSSNEGGSSAASEEESSRAIPAQGSMAPDFSLQADDGSTVSLASFRGAKKVVLYFYPKDDTPGCTKQACDFTADWKAIENTGTVVLGVSPDNLKSHVKFREKHHISFPLLVDDGAQVARDYGAWGPKSMYGRTYDGIIRSTFLIDRSGRIARVWPKVRVEGHSQDVLSAIQSID